MFYSQSFHGMDFSSLVWKVFSAKLGKTAKTDQIAIVLTKFRIQHFLPFWSTFRNLTLWWLVFESWFSSARYEFPQHEQVIFCHFGGHNDNIDVAIYQVLSIRVGFSLSIIETCQLHWIGFVYSKTSRSHVDFFGRYFYLWLFPKQATEAHTDSVFFHHEHTIAPRRLCGSTITSQAKTWHTSLLPFSSWSRFFFLASWPWGSSFESLVLWKSI